MIKEDLREEIRLKHEKIRGNPQLYDARARLVRDDLRAMGDIYSFWIENPELRKKLLRSTRNITPTKLKRIAGAGIRQLNGAWHYLMQFGSQNDFYRVFNPAILKEANARINGKQPEGHDYRTKRATLNFKNYTPPSPERVAERVNDVIGLVRQRYESDPLQTSIYAHLGLALIQPFDEGNKRTARLIQDRLLVDASLPPVIIPAGEGRLYREVLEKAAQGYATRSEEEQQMFYNYVASKVNNALDIILNDLNVNSPRGSLGVSYDSSSDLGI
jgi:Fic family protein